MVVNRKGSSTNPDAEESRLAKVDDASSDNLEYALDGLTKFVLEGAIDQEALDILTNVPVLKNVTAVVSIYGTVRNRFIVKKIGTFIDTLQSGNIDSDQLVVLREKYGDDRILEEIINRIDRLRSEVHTGIYAHLYRAVVQGKIEWPRFIQLADATELLSTTDIESEDSRFAVSGPSFLASGLATLTFDQVSGRTVMAKNGYFYNDFLQYGLEPYKKGLVEDSSAPTRTQLS